jgi:hypothetical protein
MGSRCENPITPILVGECLTLSTHVAAFAHSKIWHRFARLAGQSEQGYFYLSQAMGGGKTHSLLAFGLLAVDPKLR